MSYGINIVFRFMNSTISKRINTMSTDSVTLSSDNTPPPQPTNMIFPTLPEYPYVFGKNTYSLGKATPKDVYEDINDTLTHLGYTSVWKDNHCFVKYNDEADGSIVCYSDVDGNQIVEFRRIRGCAIMYYHALAAVLARFGLQEPPEYPPAPDLK